jgi:hypothetical protein
MNARIKSAICGLLLFIAGPQSAQAKLFKCNLRVPPQMLATVKADSKLKQAAAAEEVFFKKRTERMNPQDDKRCGTKKSPNERPSLDKLRRAGVPLKCYCTDKKEDTKKPAAKQAETAPAAKNPAPQIQPTVIPQNGVIPIAPDGVVPTSNGYNI